MRHLFLTRRQRLLAIVHRWLPVIVTLSMFALMGAMLGYSF
jgi:hypothetical protein